MKAPRYLVFEWDAYGAGGGLYDLSRGFNDREEAEQYVRDSKHDCVQMIDLEEGWEDEDVRQ